MIPVNTMDQRELWGIGLYLEITVSLGCVFADCIKTNKKDQQQQKSTLVIDSDVKSESETHAGEDFSDVSGVTLKLLVK